MLKRCLSVLFLILVLIFPGVCFAHPGGLDSLGGHYVRKSGTGFPVDSYHYHEGPYAGYIVDYKGQKPTANSLRFNLSTNQVIPKTTTPAKTIKIFINGVALAADVPPVMKDGRTLVPLRAIFEALGATVEFNAATGMITGIKGDSKIVLELGEDHATVNGSEVKLDVAANSINGRTMVPTRFIAESMGATVNWDAAAYAVKISY